MDSFPPQRESIVALFKQMIANMLCMGSAFQIASNNRNMIFGNLQNTMDYDYSKLSINELKLIMRNEELKNELRQHVRTQIGAHAAPDAIRFSAALPKTRSGKIMRRLLRDIASGAEQISQDTSTLEDYSVLAKLRGDEE